MRKRHKPKPDFLKAAAPWADTLSKSIAGIAIALYACGFLVVSLYHAKFGFVGTNPFRPRVLAAGTWFFFFTAIPLWIAAYFRTRSWSEFIKELPFIWLGCHGTSIPLGPVLFDSVPMTSIPLGIWILVGLSVGWMVLLYLSNNSKVPKWLAVVASGLLTLLYVAGPVREAVHHGFGTSTVALWFLACIVIAFLEFKARTMESLVSGEWPKVLVTIFVALLVFALDMYPHLKASWGGGTPANVTVYFSKDSLLNPNKAIQAQLIEESDEGFYILGPKESKAVFVPRGIVAMIYFGDKPADSPMLQNNKP